MQKIRSIIIDDEPLARKGLREYISETDFLEFSGEFASAPAAAGMVSNGDVDLMFLDIQMPRMTGLEFIHTLREPPPVIFTTAFPEHALEGFEVNALDYLVKPVSFERFLRAALKAREYHEIRESNRGHGETDHFFIKADQRLVKIRYDEILFAEAMQNYVTIHLADGKKYITYLTFRAVEDYLPGELFVRVHKSYIVSLGRIDSIEGTDIRIGKHQIPISRGLREEVLERILRGRTLRR